MKKRVAALISIILLAGFLLGTYISNNPFSLMVSKGSVPGHTLERKFGANPTIGTVEEDIYQGSTTYPWPTTCETLRIKAGGDVNDTAAGTGARAIVIIGLDTNWDELTSGSIATAGASASAATASCFRRVYRAYVTDVGTYTGANTGAIEIENTSSGQVLANIGAGFGQTQLTMFTIPNGKTGYLNRIFANVSGSKPVTLYFWQRRNADDVTAAFTGKRLIRPIYSTEGPQEYEVGDSSFPAKTDLWWSGKADTGTSAADVGYDLTIVDN